MLELPVAHVGHWLVSVSYFLPVLVVAGWLGATWVRGRLEGGAGEQGALDGETAGPGEVAGSV